MTHWINPWTDAIPVTLDELAECCFWLGRTVTAFDGTEFVYTKELIVKHWTEQSNKVDPYVLICPSGRHCIGVRYGNEPSEYLSPSANQAKVTELLKRKGLI